MFVLAPWLAVVVVVVVIVFEWLTVVFTCIHEYCVWCAVQQLGSSGGVVSFPHGTGIMVPGLHGAIGDGNEDGDEALRRRELRLLKNKLVFKCSC